MDGCVVSTDARKDPADGGVARRSVGQHDRGIRRARDGTPSRTSSSVRRAGAATVSSSRSGEVRFGLTMFANPTNDAVCRRPRPSLTRSITSRRSTPSSNPADDTAAGRHPPASMRGRRPRGQQHRQGRRLRGGASAQTESHPRHRRRSGLVRGPHRQRQRHDRTASAPPKTSRSAPPSKRSPRVSAPTSSPSVTRFERATSEIANAGLGLALNANPGAPFTARRAATSSRRSSARSVDGVRECTFKLNGNVEAGQGVPGHGPPRQLAGNTTATPTAGASTRPRARAPRHGLPDDQGHPLVSSSRPPSPATPSASADATDTLGARASAARQRG